MSMEGIGMKTTWRTLEPAEREAHFNPRLAVPDADTYLQRAARNAAAARERFAASSHFDIRYGPAAKQTLDVIKNPDCPPQAPTVLFVHGGYWRALDKDDHTHLAVPFASAGAVFLNVNYDLCPEVTVSEIASEIRSALVWTAANISDFGGDPDRIFLYGHSAGAHLAAMMMTETFAPAELRAGQVRGVFAISGIYEPEIARTLPVNAEIGLDAEEARLNDVLQRTPVHAWPTLIAAGSSEPAGWVEQSRAFEAHLGAHDVPAELVMADGCNHFSFLDALSDGKHPLTRTLLDRLNA